jgi:hypothetical protein
MAADGGPGHREERGDLASAEIAASQRGYDLPACRISDRRERIHRESVTAVLRFGELFQKRGLSGSSAEFQ